MNNPIAAEKEASPKTGRSPPRARVFAAENSLTVSF
jgi:hypothetical protein